MASLVDLVPVSRLGGGRYRYVRCRTSNPVVDRLAHR